MTNKQIGIWSGIGIAAIVALMTIFNVIGIYNWGNAQEQLIKADYSKNQNVLTQYTIKVQEAAQVPDMQVEALQKVVQTALSARYGEDGSKAVFQMITEQNPNLDQRTYINLQQIIEAGRDEFAAAQNMLIDHRRQYTTALGSFWTGMWMAYYGYPKIDLAKYDIVTSTRTDRIFETKHDEVIKLH